ncbi:MAG: ATP-binding cassette domain-containing protein, partial [Candidatus Omnitrophota bacterium]
CRNEGRVKALEIMREVKKAQRQAVGQARMRAQETDPSGRLVIKVMHLGFGFGDNCIVRDFTTQIMRGDKIGVIGPNGSGKTTLLRLLLKKLSPQTGKVRLGTNLEISYYDQLRGQLDEQKTVAQNVCGDSDVVMIDGKARNIIGYLQDFLFTPDRSRTPISVLSGGERNRLLLAKLFTQPSNLLVMDEPTNDLDIETLELLEELLLDYAGTLLLVSHDRSFLNNVVTSTIVLEGEGMVNEYPGGYDDWLSQRKPVAPQPKPKAKVVKETKKKEKPVVPRKLSFKEDRELKALPAQIEALESEQEQLYKQLADIAFYQCPPDEIAKAKARSEALAQEILDAYKRWEYLERCKE